MECYIEDCKEEACYAILIEARQTPTATPMISDPIIFVCKEHKNVTWDTVMNQYIWQKIVFMLTQSGIQPPLRAFSNLVAQELPKVQ